jgi:DNA-binding response OmpR family regulator
MKPRILIVEDQPDIRKLVQMTLEFGDYDVFEAENGADGLQAVARHQPAVVLLDVMMPGQLDGFQVCQRIKDDPRTAGTRVVMLSARGQKTDLATGKGVRADRYLTKPFSPLELIDTVDALLAEHGAIAQGA